MLNARKGVGSKICGTQRCSLRLELDEYSEGLQARDELVEADFEALEKHNNDPLADANLKALKPMLLKEQLRMRMPTIPSHEDNQNDEEGSDDQCSLFDLSEIAESEEATKDKDAEKIQQLVKENVPDIAIHCILGKQ